MAPLFWKRYMKGRNSSDSSNGRSSASSVGTGSGSVANGIGAAMGRARNGHSNQRTANGNGRNSPEDPSNHHNGVSYGTNGTVSEETDLSLLAAATKYHASALARKAAADKALEQAQIEWCDSVREEQEALEYLTKVVEEEKSAKARKQGSLPVASLIQDFEQDLASQEHQNVVGFPNEAESNKNSFVKAFEGCGAGVSSITQLGEDFFVTGSPDGIVRQWDFASDLCIRTFYDLDEPPNGGITSVTAVDDNKFLAATNAGTIKLWATAADVCIRTFKGHTASVTCVDVFGLDRMYSLSEEDSISTVASSTVVDQFISGSKDRTVRFWSLSTGRCRSEFTGHGDAVLCVAFLDVNRFVSGSADNTLRLWSTSLRESTHVFSGHQDSVLALAALGSKAFVSGSADNTIKLWNATTGVCERTFTGHRDGVCALTNVGDGRFLSASSGEASIKVWDVTTPQKSRTSGLHGHQKGVQTLALCVGRKEFLSGSSAGNLTLWTLPAKSNSGPASI